MELPWTSLILFTSQLAVVTPRLNSCSSCRSVPSTCTMRSGLFTRTHLPPGMNLVATVPRGACIINITELAPSANHLALRTHRDLRLFLNGVSRDFSAAGSVFSYSRVTPHGSGESLWSAGPINEPLDIMVLVKQLNPGIEYQYQLPTVHHHPFDASTRLEEQVEVSARPRDNNERPLEVSARHRENNERPLEEGSQYLTDHEEDAVLPIVPLAGEWPEHEVAWRVAGLTPCSRSCGGGEQQTVLACMRGSRATLPPEHCEGMRQPEDVVMRCNTKPCPAQWEAADWSTCSVTCGQGVQTRALICRQQISPLLVIKVSDGACLGTLPERSRRCHVGPCGSEPRWSAGDWSSCSAQCGRGLRTRLVRCMAQGDGEVASVRCSQQHKPAHEETCELASCAPNTWLFTDWSLECSSTCGAGVLTRRVRCSGGGGNSVVPEDEACDPRLKPKDSRTCHGDSTCGGTWFHGPWQKCPAQCSDGEGKVYQERRVMCMQFSRGQYRTVLESKCAGQEKPSVKRPCPHQPCNPTWFFSDWAQCAGDCSSGQRSRDVRCLDQHMRPSLECVVSQRPASQDKCSPEHCHAPDNHKAEGSCEGDKLRNCVLVVQARLCQYAYYQRACCLACAKTP